MNIIALTSNQLRHKYVSSYLSDKIGLSAIFSENRFNINAYGSQSTLIQEHFAARDAAEEQYFGTAEWPQNVPVFTVTQGAMNQSEIVEKITQQKPDVIYVFGCGVISPKIIQCCDKVINIHQGLSPYYRGSGTNFWPFYYEEPEYVGVTIHYIDQNIDTGNIICHGRPEMNVEDSLHAIGCKTIRVSAELLVDVIRILQNRDLMGIPQWNEGREFKRKDFTDESVVKVQKAFQEGLISKYLERKEKIKTGMRVIELN